MRPRPASAQSEWQERLTASAEEFPDQAKLLEMIDAGEMPDGWDADVPRFDPAEKPIATRAASEAVIAVRRPTRCPHLIGGSADLATSTNTDIADGGDVEKGSYDGRNLRFGVREHGMGAILNGLCLHGLRAYGGDVLHVLGLHAGAVRLAALMRLPSMWVWTHDSVGLGEDGPTHQPVEQLAGLRAMPRLNMIRPADATETAPAWRFALRNLEAPTGFALTRQDLPILDPAAIPDDAIERGAYVLARRAGGEPESILIATGSEVTPCLEAADLLDGMRVRVVSMPCMDTFTQATRPTAKRCCLLPAGPGSRSRPRARSAGTSGSASGAGSSG